MLFLFPVTIHLLLSCLVVFLAYTDSTPCTQPSVYTACTQPCKRGVYGGLHGPYTTIYTPRTWPCSRPIHGRYGRVRAVYTCTRSV